MRLPRSSMGGAATNRLVRVEVAQENLQRASELLDADELATQQAGPWICSRCHEQNEPAFEVCWSCTKRRSDDDTRGRLVEHDDPSDDPADDQFGASVSVAPGPPLSEDPNPYRPVLISEAPSKNQTSRKQSVSHRSQNSETLTRAFRVSIIALLLFPPLLNLYSIYLLGTLALTGAYRDRSLRARLGVVWAINLVVIAVSALFWLRIV